MPAADVDALIASGGLTPGSRVDLAKSIIGVAVRAGVAKPDISTARVSRREMLAAKSIVTIRASRASTEMRNKTGSQRTKDRDQPQSVGEARAGGEGDPGKEAASERGQASGSTWGDHPGGGAEGGELQKTRRREERRGRGGGAGAGAQTAAKRGGADEGGPDPAWRGRARAARERSDPEHRCPSAEWRHRVVLLGAVASHTSGDRPPDRRSRRKPTFAGR